jgi:holo-[acyl-carrier protein] synthase
MTGGTSVRVGADLAGVQQVVDSVARFGDRYLRRVYTEHEIACCPGLPSVAAAGLAARFAAKEATIKVLRPVDFQPDWRSIEITRHIAVRPCRRLGGSSGHRRAGCEPLT